MLAYLLLRFAAFLCATLPVPWVSHSGFFFGSLGYFLMGAKKKHIQENYQKLGFSKGQSLRLAVLSLGNYGRLITEILRTQGFTEQTVLGWDIENEPLLKQAYASGRGIAMVTFHFGNWDIAGFSLSLRGYPVSAIADHIGNPRMNRFFIETRENKKLKIIPSGKATQSIDAALQKGEIVAFLFDRPLLAGGLEVLFGSHRVRIPKGAFYFARKWGCRLLVGHALRLGPNRFRPTVVCEIPVEMTDNEEADMLAAAQKTMDTYRQVITACPEQWHMFRPFGT